MKLEVVFAIHLILTTQSIFFFLEELAMLLTHQQKENRLLCIKMKEFLYSFIVLLLTNKKKE